MALGTEKPLGITHVEQQTTAASIPAEKGRWWDKQESAHECTHEDG